MCTIHETLLLEKYYSTPGRKLQRGPFLLRTEENYLSFHCKCLSADKKTFLLSLPACMIYYLMTDAHYQLINCPRMLRSALKCELDIHFLLKFKHMKIYVMIHLCPVFIFHMLRERSDVRSQTILTCPLS